MTGCLIGYPDADCSTQGEVLITIGPEAAAQDLR